MPVAPPRPCRTPGCAALVRDGSGFCQAHQSDRRTNRFADARRASASERGYGNAWMKLRNLVMQRDCGLCQPCLKAGRVTPARQVDHIVSKSEGGTDDEANLQAICLECHKAKTGREAAQGRGG